MANTTGQPGGKAVARDELATSLAAMATRDTGDAGAVEKAGYESLAQQFAKGGSGGVLTRLNEPLNPYEQSLWVHRCVREIATSIRGVPVGLSQGGSGLKVSKGVLEYSPAQYTRTDGVGPLRRVHGLKSVFTGKAAEGDNIESGEAFELLNKPNAYQTWQQFIESLISYLELSGKVAIVLDEMIGRKPGSMHVRNGEKVKPQWANDANGLPHLLGYKYRPPKSGREIPLAVDEVKYFTLWNDSDDPLGGMGPGVPARLAIASDYNASLFNTYMFANGCDPSIVVSYPTLTPEQAEEFHQMLIQRQAGVARAKGAMVLGGNAKVDSFQSNMKDMQFGEGKKTNRLEICCAYGVPPSVAGWVDAAGDSSAYTNNALRQFWQQTIFPLLDGLHPALQEIVNRFDHSAVLYFDVEDQPVVHEMRLARIPSAKELFAMGFPANDINDRLDLGMTHTPWGDTGFLPVGLMPASMVASGDLLGAIAEGPTSPGNDELDQSTDYANGTNRGAPGIPTTPAGDIDKAAKADDAAFEAMAVHVWRAYTLSWAPLAKRLRGFLRSRYSLQQRALVAALKRRLPADAVRDAGDARPAVKDDSIVARVILDVFGKADAATFAERMRVFIEDANDLGITQALVEAGFEGERLTDTVAAMTSNPQLAAAVRSEAIIVSSKVDAATRTILRNQIARGMEAGENIRTITDRVQNVMANRRSAAATVARNAVGQTLSRARNAGQVAAGMTHKTWLHSRGVGERREAHVAAESQYRANPIPMESPFVINDVSLQYPRDASAGAPQETVNCQCLQLARRVATNGKDSKFTAEDLRKWFVGGFIGYGQPLVGSPEETASAAGAGENHDA